MPRKARSHTVGRISLRQRGRWWQARYSTPAGRVEEHLHVTSVEAAIKRAGEINAILERGEYATLESLRQGQEVTFRALVEEFKVSYTGWSPRTKKGSEGLIAALIDVWGDLPLASVTTRLISGYLAHRQAEGLTPTTCNRYLSFLRRLFDCAVKWNYLSRSPAAEVRYNKTQSHIPEALTDAQLTALLEHLPTQNHPVVIIAADTGLRRSELWALTWADVNWAEKEIIVRVSKNAEWRVIPLTDRAVEILRQLREAAVKAKLQKLDQRIFVPKDIKRSLHNAGVKAKIGHVHFHMLRHTFATRLRDRGVPLDRIKELLGHKSMVMVLRYAKARPLQLREAIQALNG